MIRQNSGHYYTVICDLCNESTVTWADSKREAAIQAGDAGWSSRNLVDRCPKCKGKRRPAAVDAVRRA